MSKAQHLFLCLAVCWAPAASGQDHPAELQSSFSRALAMQQTQSAQSCTTKDDREIVVCATPQRRYRIDPNVLAASRAAEALPPKPPVDAGGATPCVGPNCGGGTIPLVGMALTALKAAELATQGDDWREAFRTHADQYQAYQKSKNSRISIGVSAGTERH